MRRLARLLSLVVVCLLAQACDEPLPPVARELGFESQYYGRPSEFSLPWMDLTTTRDGQRPFWLLKLTVDTDGKVIHAFAEEGPEQHRSEAIAEAKKELFEPFLHEGKPVRVRIPHHVAGTPADYKGPADRTFPTDTDLSDVVIRFRRTACFGWCPEYIVDIRGNGDVTYTGVRNVLVVGRHTWRTPKEKVVELIDLFRRADYFRLDGFYEAQITDMPTYITRLSIGDRHKFVLDYGGGAGAQYMRDGRTMPVVVNEIEEAIDRLSGAESFISGDSETVDRLKAAGWRFDAAEGGLALGYLVSNCDVALAKVFVREGAAINVGIPGTGRSEGGRVVISAAECADTELVRLLEDRGALDDPETARRFLLVSVRAGFPVMVEIALKHTTDVNMQDKGIPLLHLAASADPSPRKLSGDANFDPGAIIGLLVAAGADPNVAMDDGSAPLHWANSESTFRALLKAGANPNARNEEGERAEVPEGTRLPTLPSGH